MKDYFKETEFVLDNQYRGRGIMTWNPDKGFHIQAFLDGQGKPISRIDLGKIGITLRSDICSIRMRPQGYDWAIAPNIHLTGWSKFDILNKHLSIKTERVVFCESIYPNDELFWIGSALYETKSKISLSDDVYTNTRINDQELERQVTSGISYEDAQNRTLIGRLVDDKKLQLYWQLPKKLWIKAKAWEWAIAIQDVLSIWFGETIWLLHRDFLRGTQKITEVRQRVKLSSLGLLSPFGNLKFDKESFIKLTDFFIHNPSKAEICRRIFWQLLEASNQHSHQAQELLLSTILEAVLRSIDNRPFTAKKDNFWNVGKGLENFFNTYLSFEEWTDVRRRVMKEHCYLRDRNAHPDWLFSQGGSLSEAELAQSLDSMILLSRFYGYMIFALAGFKGLRPTFLPPHQCWNAPATITVASDPDSQSDFPDWNIP
jgi:hypothetical protein